MYDEQSKEERLAEALSDDHTLGERAEKTLEHESLRHASQGQPVGLWLLFIVEMWERFSFYGMKAILGLFLIAEVSKGGFGWTESESNAHVNRYVALVYLFPVFGGILADKLLGTHRSMLIGAIIIVAGHAVLGGMGLFEPASQATLITLYTGLGLVILGTGFFKPCVTVMVGQLYKKNDSRRDAGFTLFYMGVNVGSFLGVLACGYLGEKVGWHYGFAVAGIGMVAGLLVYLRCKKRLMPEVGLPPASPEPAVQVLSKLAGALLLIAAIVVGHLAIKANAPQWTAAYLLILTAVAISAIAAFVRAQKPGDRGPTIAIFVISLFVAFFWFAFDQSGSSLTIFAKERTDRHIFGWEMPASWVQNANPFIILLFAPIFAAIWGGLARRKRDLSVATKVGLGLFFAGAGFLVMVFAAKITDGGAPLGEDQAPVVLVGMGWLAATYLLHTWGELCLSPIGLSMVSRLAPVKYVSLLMGVWFLAPSLANMVAAEVMGSMDTIEDAGLLGVRGKGGFFMLFVLTSCGAGTLIILLNPFVKRMVAGRA